MKNILKVAIVTIHFFRWIYLHSKFGIKHIKFRYLIVSLERCLPLVPFGLSIIYSPRYVKALFLLRLVYYGVAIEKQ